MHIQQLHQALIGSKQPLSFRESQTIDIVCPHCGSPLFQYHVHSNQEQHVGADKWTTISTDENNSEIFYFDGDSIELQEDLYKKLDAELLVGKCSKCKKQFVGITLFMVKDSVEAQALWVVDERDFVKDVKFVEQYEIILENNIIGRLLIYRQIVHEDKTIDLYRIDIDSLTCSTTLETEYGVCNGHYEKNVWQKASEINAKIYEQTMSLKIENEKRNLQGECS